VCVVDVAYFANEQERGCRTSTMFQRASKMPLGLGMCLIRHSNAARSVGIQRQTELNPSERMESAKRDLADGKLSSRTSIIPRYAPLCHAL